MIGLRVRWEYKVAAETVIGTGTVVAVTTVQRDDGQHWAMLVAEDKTGFFVTVYADDSMAMMRSEGANRDHGLDGPVWQRREK